ncbi:Hsp70 protein-domain-containing protein [Aspergillus undulatus]|uniref:Hsp70 protein-domain-containing protein n=1 Tax=Aspergillus undulatus TaxID=1810928 RepID=UPI003CCDF932
MSFPRTVKTRRRARRRRLDRASLLTLGPGVASLFLFLVFLFALRTQACEREPLAGEKVIGIHLGASESRVGVVQNGQISILTTPENKTSIPSYVAATDTGLLAGEEARRSGGLNLFKAVLDMKIYFDEGATTDPPFSPPGSMYSYTLKDNNQVLEVDYNGTCHSLSPEEIYAPLLVKLRDIAESHIGPDIAGAVVASPLPYDEITMAELDSAGLQIGLPIVRRMREPMSMLLALGLDDLSYDGERYVLLFELSDDYNTLTTSLIEIDMGVMDTLAVHREHGISKGLYEESYPTTEQDRAFQAGSDPVRATMESLMPYIEHHLQETLPWAVTDVLRQCEKKHENITDLIFSPSLRAFPEAQRRMIRWFNALGIPASQIRIANAESLDKAPVWGAVLVSHLLTDEDSRPWTPCSCETYRPPIGIGTSNKGVVQVLDPCYRIPVHVSETFRASCGASNGNQTTIQVYMRDVPSVDYHAMMEMGELYTAPESAGDILLGEFDLPTPCLSTADTVPAMIDISILITRVSVLKVQAVNRRTGKSGTLTIPTPAFECGAEGRYERMNFTLSRGGDAYLDKDLSKEYWADLRELVTSGEYERPANKFDERLFARWVDWVDMGTYLTIEVG